MLAGILVGVTIVSENPAALYACIPSNMYPPERLEQLANSAQQRAEFLRHTQLAFGLKSVQAIEDGSPIAGEAAAVSERICSARKRRSKSSVWQRRSK
jgi:hypothetical protein